MKAANMDVAHLLCDESFINYCRQSSPQDIHYWENYLRQNPGKSTLINFAREQYLDLFNALALTDRDEQELKLTNRLNLSDPAPVVQMEAAGNEKLRSTGRLWRTGLVAAAVLGVLAIFALRYYNNKKDAVKIFAAAYGERKNIQLPDGSLVILNGGSTIEIRESFGNSSRDVYLEGEAFFDVKHQDTLPFIVHTAVMDVKAIGTAFNTKAYSNERITETSLIRGLVEVTLKENHNSVLLLHPNEKIQWAHTSGVIVPGSRAVNNTDSLVEKEGLLKKLGVTDDGDIIETAWKENKLIFEAQPFGEIAIQLERWYGAKINFKDESLRNYRFTGTYEKEDLLTVLNDLKETSGFNYTIEQDKLLTINITK